MRRRALARGDLLRGTYARIERGSLGDQLYDQAGLRLKSFTMEQLVIEGAERPTLDAGAGSAEQIATR